MKVLWTESALAQLLSIHRYLSQTSPDYALRIVDRLTKRSTQIASFPFAGRAVREYELENLREVIEGSYRIIYLVEAEPPQVEVLAIIHTSREPVRPLDELT